MTLARRLLPSTTATGSGYASPPYDDEFNGPNATWTVVGPNSADFNTTTPGAAHLQSGMRIIRTRVPPVPFTVTAFCSGIVFDNVNTTYANASLAIGGSANAGTTGDRHYAFQWDVAILGEIGVIDGVWSNYSTQVAQNNYTKLGNGTTFQIPHYQRLVVHSGTNVDAYYSLNGTSWSTYITGYNPAISVQAVLLLSYACTTDWDWVRFT